MTESELTNLTHKCTRKVDNGAQCASFMGIRSMSYEKNNGRVIYAKMLWVVDANSNVCYVATRYDGSLELASRSSKVSWLKRDFIIFMANSRERLDAEK